MVCAICNSSKLKKSKNISDSTTYVCGGCSIEFIHPQPHNSRLNEIYSKDYYNSWGLNKKGAQITRNMKYQTGINHLNQVALFHSKGKLLDIGCAFGFFLEAARDKNFETYGIEFSKHSSSIAKEKFGANNIFNGIIENSSFKKNMFDIITMFDLIEHTRQPKETLKKAIEILAPNGIIALSTPNRNSLSRYLMGKKWIHYKEEHLFYFNKKSIENLANELDLEIVKIKTFKKVFYLSYVLNQFEIYKHFIFTPFFRFINKVLPENIKNKPFSLSIGEMFVILKQKA